MPSNPAAPSGRPVSVSSSASAPSSSPRHTIHRMKLVWSASHLAYCLFTVRYMVSLLLFDWSSNAFVICYRAALMCAVVAYSLVVYKTFTDQRSRFLQAARLSSASGGTSADSSVTSKALLSLLASEDSHYLVMILVWLVSRQNPFALISLAIYALYHILVFFCKTFAPYYLPRSMDPMVQTLRSYGEPCYGLYMKSAIRFEILAWFTVLFSCLTFNMNSIIVLVIYTVFLRLRYRQQSAAPETYAVLGQKIDRLLADAPPTARSIWASTKHTLNRFENSTRAYVASLDTLLPPKLK